MRIGLIADLHHDLIHDAERRLDVFLNEMATVAPDAIMQLGDFAYPDERNRAVIDKFNRAHPRSLHVIGNHDTDDGHTKQQCLDIWGMGARYYSEDIGGLRFLVLDGNDQGSPTHKGGYASYVGREQVAWLADQLATHAGPVVIVSHQPLAGLAAIDNAEELQAVLGPHAEKVLLAINGHTHIDDLLRISKINYFHVNSASYKWVGGNYKHNSYAPEIHEKFPWLNHTCPYRDPLYTTLTFDPGSGTISFKGIDSEWVGESPAELGDDHSPEITNGEEIAPRIRPRRIERRPA